MRRRLTPYEASRITERQRKKQIHFPQRKYAVKVGDSLFPLRGDTC